MSAPIVVVNDCLPQEAFAELARFIEGETMTYGARSNFRTDPHGHWSRNFTTAGKLNLADVTGDLEANERGSALAFAWRFLREAHLGDDLLIRCYLNGYTYGTDGYFHTDSKRPDERTTIVYMNDYWEPDWAGETVFLDAIGEIDQSVLPKTNRAVIFPSDVQHAGRSVSRKCMVLRKTLIFKSRKRRSDDFEKLSVFLRAAGATTLQHSDSTLHDHLLRTFAILEDRGFAPDVCLGGGLHAIYGTNLFSPQIVSPDAGAEIAGEFGSRAEELARTYSELERPRSFESPQELTDEFAVVVARDGQTRHIPRATFDDLRAIECANLIDQDVLARYPNLRRFWKG